ncbi:MAG: peptidoglycan editing factor PgeF [Wenzhouxiangellaceae bacterium]|nr:peptidoglycan editing factor PgeF [Wenzhouxiangellaceae bacterium]
MGIEFVAADRPGPLRAGTTARSGGASRAPFDSLNLGDRCGDEPAAVAANRARVAEALDLPGEPLWLRQVHGIGVIEASEWRPGVEADAAWTDAPGVALAVLTADCLPVVLADGDGRCLAVAHAGWRGLAAGVLQSTVEALPASPSVLRAWIGPRIGPDRYEVDAAVREAFDGRDAFFRPTRPGHWQADLPGIAEAILNESGLAGVVDCGHCTASEPARWFSHRRDGRSGRMATLAWLIGRPG